MTSYKGATMDLFILRHAVAVERGTPGYARDSDRPLTPDGERTMLEIAHGIQALGLAFDLILSSPYLRARRTAEIAAKVLGGSVEFSDALSSDGNPEELVRQLRARRSKKETVLLVGHEPYLSGLISILLTGTTSVTATLKKGGLCRLSVKNLSYGPCASLEWLLTPKQLRLIR